MKVFLFLVEICILGFMIYFNILNLKKSIQEGGDEEKTWKWVIIILTFAFSYFLLNATYQALFVD